MIPRHVSTPLLTALSDTPVVFLSGARQVGKSTLAKHLASTAHPARYITLDDAAMLGAARSDPEGFIAGIRQDVVIDEVQRVPELLMAIKASVDRNRSAGRYLLTGSADVLQLPRAAEYLVGRMEVIHLWPLSQGELRDVKEGFVDAAFGAAPPHLDAGQLERSDLHHMLCRGGYPDVQDRSPERRSAYFEAYLQTILLREVRALSAIEGVTELPRLLRLVAARTGSHLNVADIARTGALPQQTVRRYLALLRTLLMLERIPAWSRNVSKRLVKSPKLYVTDPGLTAHLIGQSPERLADDATAVGPLLETFIVTELLKQLGWAETRATLHHARTYGGREVDIILEDARGRCVAIEVKATASLASRHLKGMRAFADLAGDRFHRGLVLYGGHEVVPYADNIHAVPLTALWTWGAGRRG